MRLAPRPLLALSILFIAAGSGAAHAATVATFNWVPATPASASGSLTLSLPDTITTPTFNTGNLGSTAAAQAAITGLTYTYSNGLSVGLADLTTWSIPGNDFATSNSVTPAFGPLGIYLISDFTLTGSKVFPGDARAATFKLANAEGSANLVAYASNQMTPFAGQGVAANDAGYWRLSSFTTTPVPLPAAAWLLVSGAGVLAGFARRRRLPA